MASQRGQGDTRRGDVAKVLRAFTLLLSGVAALIGAFNSCSINANKNAIEKLTQEMQLTKQFSEGIEQSRHFIAVNAKTDEDKTSAMVELLRLYALATTPQQKLAVLQMAIAAGQKSAVADLSVQVKAEQFYLAPISDSDKAAKQSLDTVMTAGARSMLGTPLAIPRKEVPPASHGSPLSRALSAPEFVPDSDAPLTQSSNPTISANATLLATLQSQGSGWIFLGDAYQSPGLEQKLHLFVASATTSSKTIAKNGDHPVACQDINLRKVPFENGSLGQAIGIIAARTPMLVTAPPYAQDPVKSFPGIGKLTGKPIIAYWAYVQVTSEQPMDSGGAC